MCFIDILKILETFSSIENSKGSETLIVSIKIDLCNSLPSFIDKCDSSAKLFWLTILAEFICKMSPIDNLSYANQIIECVSSMAMKSIENYSYFDRILAKKYLNIFILNKFLWKTLFHCRYGLRGCPFDSTVFEMPNLKLVSAPKSQTYTYANAVNSSGLTVTNFLDELDCVNLNNHTRE